MAEVIKVPFSGLFAVEPVSAEDAMTSVRNWLLNLGWSTEVVDNEALANRSPQEAWFCEEFGFVYETHPCAIHGMIVQVHDVYMDGPQ